MNIPTFYIYVQDPPTPMEAAFAKYMQQGNFQVMVSAKPPPSTLEIQKTTGLFFDPEERVLKDCADYIAGKILCLQVYSQPLNKEELEIIRQHFLSLYDVGETPLDLHLSQTFIRLSEMGCMNPVTPSQPLATSFDYEHGHHYDSQHLAAKWDAQTDRPPKRNKVCDEEYVYSRVL